MRVDLASTADFEAFIALAAEVEDWFGPMVSDPGFHDAVRRNIARGSALVAVDAREIVGALLFSVDRAPTYDVRWLVVRRTRLGPLTVSRRQVMAPASSAAASTLFRWLARHSSSLGGRFDQRRSAPTAPSIKLPKDVGATGMAVDVGAHMHEGLMQGICRSPSGHHDTSPTASSGRASIVASAWALPSRSTIT
jgi:hypothetical protein